MQNGLQLIHGDCLEKMSAIPTGTVDMILCDLPYGTTACKWDTIIPLPELWDAYKRIVKPNGAIVLTASQPFTSALVMSNPKMFRYEWIWKKSQGRGYLNANRMPLKAHESILVFASEQTLYNPQYTSGQPYRAKTGTAGLTCNNGGKKNIRGYETINEGKRSPVTVIDFCNETGLHPTQKPVALMEYLVRTYTNEGETVLDNCFGSGTTGVACINTGRNFIGIERDETYFCLAVKRIADAQRALITL